MTPLKNDMELLPGWHLHFDEISYNHYKVLLRDAHGKTWAMSTSDVERAVVIGERYAFELERSTNKVWEYFIYDYTLLKLKAAGVDSDHKNGYAYGSWSIFTNGCSWTYSGRDDCFIIAPAEGIGFDFPHYKLSFGKELDFDYFQDVIRTLTQSV